MAKARKDKAEFNTQAYLHVTRYACEVHMYVSLNILRNSTKLFKAITNFVNITNIRYGKDNNLCKLHFVYILIIAAIKKTIALFFISSINHFPMLLYRKVLEFSIKQYYNFL